MNVTARVNIQISSKKIAIYFYTNVSKIDQFEHFKDVWVQYFTADLKAPNVSCVSNSSQISSDDLFFDIYYS